MSVQWESSNGLLQERFTASIEGYQCQVFRGSSGLWWWTVWNDALPALSEVTDKAASKEQAQQTAETFVEAHIKTQIKES